MMLCLQTQKEYRFKLLLLDDREFKFTYKGTQKCEQMLIDMCKILCLEEKNYFSFKYYNSDLKLQWVDLGKSIHSQFKPIYIEGNHEIVIYFCVKYYITDPCKLIHELTRYLYYLQLRKDIIQGRLPLQFDYAVDLFAYFLQDELGDYNPKRDLHGYAAEYEFMPNQTIELEKSAESKHMKLKGMSQPLVEMNFLNKAKWLDMYGVDMHHVLDEYNVEHSIGLTPTGISVFNKNSVKINSYFWPRIKKLNYRCNKLMLTVIDKTNEERTHVFMLESKSACKHLWKSCVDQHEFFKIKTVYEEPAKINTASVTNKRNSTVMTNQENKVYIKRVPAKRIKPKNDFMKESNQQNLNDNKTNENGVSENGNIVFNADRNERRKDVENSDSPDDFLKTIDLNQIKNSPTMSTKSIHSYKYNNSSNKRRESASENETGLKRKSNRNRSKTRRSTTNEDSGGDKVPSQETDSDTNLLKKNKSEHDLADRKPVHRSSSNTSTGSRRHRSSQGHHRRTHSKNSNKLVNIEYSENYIVSEARIIRNRSKRSLANQQSGANLIRPVSQYEQSETCHETSMDENDRLNEQERKRQIRRRKRSKSPGGSAILKPPEEILQHIKYDLIESNGMSADQLKEIPFVKVETTAPAFRISPHQKHRRISPRRRKSGEFQDSKSSIVAYVRDGTAQIAKTNKLVEATEIAVTAKINTVTICQAVNTKLNHFEEANNMVSDSGCEDMHTRQI